MADGFYVGRQPILDRGKRVVGHELFFRSSEAQDLLPVDIALGNAGQIAETLNGQGLQRLVGEKTPFINIQLEAVGDDAVRGFRTAKTVFEVQDTESADPALLTLCQELKGDGYHFCLDHFTLKEPFSPLLRLVQFIKVDISRRSPNSLATMVTLLKKLPVKLIALRVDTGEEYERCHGLGFELFQGSFFTKPSGAKAKHISPSHVVLIELSNLLAKNEDTPVLEAIFKKNPELTFALLKLMNSAFFRVRQEVTSIRQAIALLGYDNLKKWMALLLFTIDRYEPGINPLFEKALIRGRMMELLAEKTSVPGVRGDSAFMTGIFSLVNILFDVPLKEVVARINLTKEIREALIEHEGWLGGMLLLVEALDLHDYERVASELQRLNLSGAELFAAEMTAIMDCQASLTADEKRSPGGSATKEKRAPRKIETREEEPAPSTAAPRQKNVKPVRKKTWLERLRAWWPLRSRPRLVSNRKTATARARQIHVR